MSVTITINAETAEMAAFELVSFVKSLPTFSAPIVTAPSAPASVEAPKERTTRNRAPRAEQTLVPQAETSTAAADPEPREEAPEQIVAFADTDVAPVSLEDLRAKAAVVAQSGKQAGVKALLTKYEARSVSAVPEDQRSAFMADLNSLEMAEAS